MTVTGPTNIGTHAKLQEPGTSRRHTEMRYEKRLIATTHVDQHRERIAFEALESMVDQARERYIPVVLDHDPRFPPLGRTIKNELVELPDGEHGIVATWQIFEPGDVILLDPSGREMAVHDFGPGRGIFPIYDYSYRHPQDQRLLQQLEQALGDKAEYFGKKSLEPISVLMLGAAATLGGIAAGFLNKLGSDLADRTLNIIRRLVARRRKEGRKHLVGLYVVVEMEDHRFAVEVFATNPSAVDLTFLIKDAPKHLDAICERAVASQPDVRKLVLEVDEGRLWLAYGIRKDCVPVYPEIGETGAANGGSA